MDGLFVYFGVESTEQILTGKVTSTKKTQRKTLSSRHSSPNDQICPLVLGDNKNNSPSSPVSVGGAMPGVVEDHGIYLCKLRMSITSTTAEIIQNIVSVMGAERHRRETNNGAPSLSSSATTPTRGLSTSSTLPPLLSADELAMYLTQRIKGKSV